MYRSTLYLILILMGGMAQAQDQTPPDVGYWGHSTLAVYREDGELTADALQNLELLKIEANLEGYVTLWLTANAPYNPETDTMSPRQVAMQNRAVRRILHDVIRPLRATGLVWYVLERPRIEGPGRLVRANLTGLMRLVEDERLLHIHGQ